MRITVYCVALSSFASSPIRICFHYDNDLEKSERPGWIQNHNIFDALIKSLTLKRCAFAGQSNWRTISGIMGDENSFDSVLLPSSKPLANEVKGNGANSTTTPTIRQVIPLDPAHS
ncbi:hypothetical protein PFISCL1PPCAC_9430 [Pristionchus fissidentatus]|uniref:Uncharacterized protein n=1 Tax=Pristionchus fissidentatus TaxID=1538716 RepID=A0AAV5VIP0_9BILA|nr:hypothetical protein PFISCL1PPCAC_9430 [Pristionchus fissidentatus]